MLNFVLETLNVKALGDTQEEHDKSSEFITSFIISQFGMLTVEEIKEAFRMYASKQFEAKVFRMLDCVLVGEVLTSYIDFRNESLATYKPKNENMKLEVITSTRKKEINEGSVNRVYSEYKNDNYLQENTEYIFDYLAEVGSIKLATEETVKLKAYYEKKMLEAKEELLTEKQREMKIAKSKVNPAMVKILQTAIDEIESLSGKKIVIRTKRLVLIDFFNKCILDGKQIIF